MGMDLVDLVLKQMICIYICVMKHEKEMDAANQSVWI